MRIAVLFAIALNLIAAGGLTVVRATTAALPSYAWPVAATLLIAATAAVFVAAMRRIGAPLGNIIAAAHRVGDGDLSVRLVEQGLPWLRAVARAFNTMADGLERQQHERRALMADIAHELRTPVAVIQGRVEGMLDGLYPRDEVHVRQVLDETRMLGRLVEDLRTSAHAESGTLALRKEPADIGALVEDAADAFRPDAHARNVQVHVHAPGELPVHADPGRIREVLVNLLSNALRYAPDGSVVRIECACESGRVIVRVMDEGPGIAAGDLAKVFDRFYKGAGSTGSGLGLTIARSLVVAHGGTIAAANRDGGGATITMELPCGDGG